MNRPGCFGGVVIGVALLAVGEARGAAINLFGDLGQQSWNSNFTSPINSTQTVPFSRTIPGVGSVSGDVITTNTGGTSFDMVLTNFTFTATNPVAGTNIQIQLFSYFTTAAQPVTYTGSHSASGNWSTALGNFVGFTSRHDLTGSDVSLPALAASNNFGSTGFFLGPATASVTSNLQVFAIVSEITLAIQGAGSITLPNSYDVNATAVPAPTAGLALAAGAFAARRRR